MSDDQNRNNPALRPNPFTQTVGKTSDNTTFTQSPLLRVDHEDPGLHYIGEGLPMPGVDEASWAGQLTDVGTSPIPARADHSHDTYLRYTSMSSGANVCPPGSTLLTHDNWTGEDWYAPSSSSLLVIPQSGAWFISLNIQTERAGGGSVFQNECNIIFWYVNGSAYRAPYRNNLTGLYQTNHASVQDFIFYPDANIGVDATVEVAYSHSDVVNHEVYVRQLTIIRLAEYP